MRHCANCVATSMRPAGAILTPAPSSRPSGQSISGVRMPRFANVRSPKGHPQRMCEAKGIPKGCVRYQQLQPAFMVVNQSRCSLSMQPETPRPSSNANQHRNAPRNAGLAVSWSITTLRALRGGEGRRRGEMGWRKE